MTQIYENGSGNVDSMVVEVDEDPNEVLMNLAKEIEDLAISEKETYSPILKKWHPVPSAVAAVTLHNCFSVVLKQYVSRMSGLTNESVRVLQSASKLEKVLVHMVVEDSVDCEDGGKAIVKEMIPYEVDSVILNLMKSWINERLRIGRECVNRAKETEVCILKALPVLVPVWPSIVYEEVYLLFKAITYFVKRNTWFVCSEWMKLLYFKKQ